MVCVYLYAADDAYLHAFYIEKGVWEDMKSAGVINADVGAEMLETAVVDDISQAVVTSIELMVADGCGIEANLVHKCCHRIAGMLILVVVGVSGTVIAGREKYEVWVNGAERVDEGCKAWHAFEVGMHVVDGDYLYMLCLCCCKQA